MPTNPYAWLEQSLATIHKADWYRSVQRLQSRPGAVVQLEGREVINFASNDYLGLAGDERLIQAAIAATQEYGTGSTGSRLLSGHRELHRELECAIASLKQTEDALVFSSGYLANLGTIAALVGKRDLILADQYNHSSLKNGAILSGAAIVDYAHADTQDLKSKLAQHRQHHRRCLITTDSVFSMDGDICQLPEILELAEEFSCMVLVDEAHATGVLGATGAGCVEHFGCTGNTLIQVGTLSKALGSLGGYVAGSTSLIDFLRNRAPSWIYTTALSPADTAAALAAIQIVQQECDRESVAVATLGRSALLLKADRRAQLHHNIDTLKQLIAQKLPHLNLLPSESPILCIPLASATDALNAGRQLKASGIFAPAIRPPTVPTSRIRLCVMATHELAHLQKLVEALEALNLPK
jgi:8-amino-7-oxononanoate synthase